MKNEDFERLKAKLGDEFDAYNNEYGVVIVEKKKDIWEGVEFLSVIGFNKIYKIKGISNDVIFVEPDMCFTKSVCVPSTEQAYVEQLKKEAFERFGEIKEGDRFDQRSFGTHIDTINFIPNMGYDKGFTYQKNIDALWFDNLAIYQQGKWATKVKERVKVNAIDLYIEVSSGGPYLIKPEFSIKNVREYDKLKLMGFLASKLESYLNGEIGETMTFTESISIPKNYEG